jgi:hypothetical protein
LGLNQVRLLTDRGNVTPAVKIPLLNEGGPVRAGYCGEGAQRNFERLLNQKKGFGVGDLRKKSEKGTRKKGAKGCG